MKELISKITKLIDVKSIMTLILTVAFVMLVSDEKVDGQQFMAVFTMVVGFYFGTQSKKGGG